MAGSAADFVMRWGQSELREQQGAQSHFNELCQLVGHATPTEQDPHGSTFTFEKQVVKADGRDGRADVWYLGHFAWEYKGKYKDLDSAYAQLLSYKTALENPPLLVVCDFETYRIYPQWTNTNAEPFVFTNADLVKPHTQDFIRWLLTDPNEFLETRKRELGERAAVTEKLAADFAHLADQMRAYKHGAQSVWSSLQIARFLTRLVFGLFAEDIGLLPSVENKPVLRYIVELSRKKPQRFAPLLHQLFAAMNGEADFFSVEPVPYFNGGLFAESQPGAGDGTEVLDLADQAVTAGVLETLEKVTNADWRMVNPTIFGTLFEAALDANKRAQLGAHYTSEADIRLIIEPVLIAPLQHEWDAIRTQADPLLQIFAAPGSKARQVATAHNQLTTLRDTFLDRLASVRVLDPACGSGNFLYVSLKALKDLESHVHSYFSPLNLPFRDVITPRQLFGIERDEFAAKLAHVVIWIGYLQWRYEAAGQLIPVMQSPQNSREISIPILNDKTEAGVNRILNDDAILRYDADGRPYEPEWPDADVIVGNPPFLGGNRIRAELKNKYVDALFTLYRDKVPAFADLVCYWFEKARAQIEHGKTKRAGLISTNSIRGGVNREVLTRIKATGNIFMAWGDRAWILPGAAVRVSIIGFDNGDEYGYTLDGLPVSNITPDLVSTVDLTHAKHLKENESIAFRGNQKGGAFDIDAKTALNMLAAINESGRSNQDVIKLCWNGLDVTRRPRNMWLIDFGTNMLESEARLYAAPFEYIEKYVKPERDHNNRAAYRERWWIHNEARPSMRHALLPLKRYLATPHVSKYRLVVWIPNETIPDHQLIAFARDDDYFFGVLHSYLHECWALRLGTSLEDRPRYTPTTTFETFPFPWAPGHEPTDDLRLVAIANAAQVLNAERDAWLNPPTSVLAGSYKLRTLTNLYNALEKHRENMAAGEDWKVLDGQPAAKFAPRLAELHAALDNAVLAAYGWSDLAGQLRTESGDEEMLQRLLALNAARAVSNSGSAG